MAPVTRNQAATQDEQSLPGTSSTVPLAQDIMPLEFDRDDDPNDPPEQQDASATATT